MTGILFDLDGTLLDTLEDITAATNYILRQFGCPERTRQEVRRATGNGSEVLLRMCFPEGTDEETIQAALVRYKAYYTDHCRSHTRPYPGIPEALETLRKTYPLAVVSNKPDSAVKALCADYFPGMYALGEHPGCPRKPAADMVHQGMAALGVDRCIYVGDSEVDVQTAKNAGMPCLAVLWGFRDKADLEGADGYCAHPSLLAEKIEKLI